MSLRNTDAGFANVKPRESWIAMKSGRSMISMGFRGWKVLSRFVSYAMQ